MVAGLSVCLEAFVDLAGARRVADGRALLLGLPLGAMTMLMVHGLTGGRWGEAMRPPLRATVATLPLALLFLLPVLLRVDLVFPWAGPSSDHAAGDGAAKACLSQRAVLPHSLHRLRDRLAGAGLASILGWTAPDKHTTHNEPSLAIGLIVHGLAVTVFAIDWMLSIDPEFTSTIYAMLEASAEVVGASAVALLVLAASARD